MTEESRQVEPDTRATQLEDTEYGRLIAAIVARWPEDRFSYRAHFTPGGIARDCTAHLEVRDVLEGVTVAGLEAAGREPDDAYRHLRTLVQRPTFETPA